MIDCALVAAGGAIGCLLRYGLARLVAGRGGFPYATLLANIISGLAVGLFVGLSRHTAMPERARLFVAVGLLGGMSTFSTFSAETVALAEARRFAAALGNVAANLCSQLGLAAFGIWLVGRVFK